jgi:hypothetical protein
VWRAFLSRAQEDSVEDSVEDSFSGGFAMQRLHHPALALVLVLIPVLLACSLGTGTTTGGVSTGPTPTPTPPPCPTHASATAEAWAQSRQVHGHIGGGAATTLSHFVYPLGLPGEPASDPYSPFLSNIVWAPDALHLAVDVNVSMPDEAPSAYPYVVDTTTHAVTRVPDPAGSSLGAGRNLAWADNHTLLIFTGDTPAGGQLPGGAPTAFYSYNITTAALATLPGVAHAATDGVVRCSTLYYLEVTPFATIGMTPLGQSVYRGNALIHRYNLATHTELGAAFPISQTWDEDGSFGFYQWSGWDVASDNTHIAYQQMQVTYTAGASGPTIHSHFFAANPDAPVPVTSQSGADLAISPNGTSIAVTRAYPTPNIATGNMSGGGVRYYTPDAASAPAWLADSSGFDANTTSFLSGDIERYLLSTPLGGSGRAPGSVQVVSAQLPATLP